MNYLTEEEQNDIREWKMRNKMMRKYAQDIIKERNKVKEQLVQLEMEGKILNDKVPIEKQIEEIKKLDEPPEEVKIIKKRPYKAYYKCQTCGNSFSSLSILRKHLILLKGCSFLSDTAREVDNLLKKYIENLELKINSYKMDLEASNKDFTTKKKRLDSMKDSIYKIETLLKNQGHLYDENKRTILTEYIAEYKQDIKILLLEYYKIIEKSDLYDL